ncbi:Flavin reductase [Arthrobacter sp. 9AX]|nr:Flavin reductase [Arthrobacter sp. 9AX]
MIRDTHGPVVCATLKGNNTPNSFQEYTMSATSMIDPRDLRHAFGRFGTGVTVVTTTSGDGQAHGATVSAFTSVSLDPPLAQVTLMRSSKLATFVKDRPFAINVMSMGQLGTCLHFAGKPMKGGPAWGRSATGVPVLAGNAATLECRPWRIYDGGDHLIVVGEVEHLEITPLDPLIFFGGKFHHLGRLVDGTPWEQCGDGHEAGWITGAAAFGRLSAAV